MGRSSRRAGVPHARRRRWIGQASVRVLIFHGYLLGGTGSNVYTAKLAEALTRLGHEVHLLCQDRHPQALPFVDAVASWDTGVLEVSTRRDAPRCTVYRPDIGGLLPVYVADRYEALEARTFAECTLAEVDAYVDANVEAVGDVLARCRPEVALANHLVMGPVVLARALAGSGVPYAVKIHGSALEYTVKPGGDRFLGAAREGLAGARAVLVGSGHTAASLWSAMRDDSIRARTRLGPPGVDVEQFTPRTKSAQVEGLDALRARLTDQSGDANAPIGDGFARDTGAGRALATIDPQGDRLVAFVGKLIVSKGIDLLLAAWPLVLERVPAGRLVVVGFGAFRAGVEQLIAALGAGDLSLVATLAARGRALEGGPVSSLGHLAAFVDSLKGAERERYRLAAAQLPERVVLTGRLEHAELADLLPACEALAVPSTFPESFGMVAVEAAACGAFPVSAEHSGLAEVSGVLERAVPSAAAGWLSFPVGPGSVPALADRLASWLQTAPALREATRRALVEEVRERWSWEGVARVVIRAAQGHLEVLPAPSVPTHPPAPGT